ncbi:MAG: hypothetical protein RIC91_12075 [Gammaproteobacteria bacterium]
MAGAFEQGCSNERIHAGRHVYATLENHETTRVAAGHDNGVVFLLVPFL